MRNRGIITFTLLTAFVVGWFQVRAETQTERAEKNQAAPKTEATDFATAERTDQEVDQALLPIEPATMSQWKRGDPSDPTWMTEELEKHVVVPPTDNRNLIGKGQGATYGNVTEQNVAVWDRETYKAAVEGSRIFHSGEELGSEIGVSCDMCHPDGSNTHPETYPKFQVQLGRVALLRDMINWCIENPVKGEVLAPDSHKMRALEAYIYAQRKGTPLAYGKR
jgi:thiosulfate dehydrogenase